MQGARPHDMSSAKTKRTTGATGGPKSRKGFCWRMLCVASPCLAVFASSWKRANQLLGLTLALHWPPDTGLWTLAFGHGSRRTGRYRRWSFRRSSLGRGMVRETRFDQPTAISTTDPTDSPEDRQRFLHEI